DLDRLGGGPVVAGVFDRLDESTGDVGDVDAVGDLGAVAVDLDGAAGQCAARHRGEDFADLARAVRDGHGLAGSVGVDGADDRDLAAAVGVEHPPIVLRAGLADGVRPGAVVAHPVV